MLIPPKIKLIGDTKEGERLRGFALSQLQILHNSMSFQNLKVYTRVVRFDDGSYIHAFSSFGVDVVTVYVPPVSLPEREVVEVIEDVFVYVDSCKIGIDLPVVYAGVWTFVEYCWARDAEH